MENINAPFVDRKEDGSTWVYYRDQALDITDKIGEDGICYVQLKDGNHTLYMTIKCYEDGSCGYSTGKHNFPSPRGLD